MTLKAALDGVETALILIEKTGASAEDKIDALRKLLFQLRSDIIDVSEHSYKNYLEPEPVEQTEMQSLVFDDAEAQQKFYDNLSQQEINMLRNYYDIGAFREIDNARLRVCLAQALCQCATDKNVKPNNSWLSVINAEGNI